MTPLQKLEQWVSKDPNYRQAEVTIKYSNWGSGREKRYHVGIYNGRGVPRFRLYHVNKSFSKAVNDAIKGNGRDGRIVVK